MRIKAVRAGNLRDLDLAVNIFQNFQREMYPQVTETTDNGEWVFGREFDMLCGAYIALVENCDPEALSKASLNKMLYIIARDSERSHLLAQTLDHPKWFEALCRQSIHTGYYNAKWQFAEQLGGYQKQSDITTMLFDFIDSGDEYTERMALQSLCEHYPEQVEKYAEKFWHRNIYEQDEYQKIMALYVLHRINSPLLPKYIGLAYATGYQYLQEWADRYAAELSAK